MAEWKAGPGFRDRYDEIKKVNLAIKAMNKEDKVSWLTDAIRRSPVLYGAAVLGLPAVLLRRPVDGRPLASFLVAALLLGVVFIHRGFFPYYIASAEPFLAVPASWGLVSIPWAFAAVLSRVWGAPAARWTGATLGGVLSLTLVVRK